MIYFSDFKIFFYFKQIMQLFISFITIANIFSNITIHNYLEYECPLFNMNWNRLLRTNFYISFSFVYSNFCEISNIDWIIIS